MTCSIIFCFNCIRFDENATFETGLSSQLSSSSDCQESSLEGLTEVLGKEGAKENYRRQLRKMWKMKLF